MGLEAESSIETTRTHLEEALSECDTAEANRHIRESLQLLEVVENQLE